jgi:hypothetical protein
MLCMLPKSLLLSGDKSGSVTAASELSESYDPMIAGVAALSGSLGTVRRGRVRSTENRGSVFAGPIRPIDLRICAAKVARDALGQLPRESICAAGSGKLSLVTG